MNKLAGYVGQSYNDIMEAQQDQFVVFLEFIIAVLMVIAAWKLFTKAGEAGWKSLIPVYNLYLLFKISMGNGWFFILLFIPIARYVALILFAINMAKCFGKGTVYIVGLILLPPIFMMLLGLSNANYLGPKGFGDFRPDEDFGGVTYEYETRENVSRNFEDDFSDGSNAQTVEFETEENE